MALSSQLLSSWFTCGSTLPELFLLFQAACQWTLLENMTHKRAQYSLYLNRVTVSNQKDKEQEREERNQGPSWSFTYDFSWEDTVVTWLHFTDSHRYAICMTIRKY